MKKTILLSLPVYSSYYLPIKEAFQELGYEVLLFDYRHGNFSTKLIRLLFGNKRAERHISASIAKIANKNQPEFVLFVKGEIVSQKLLLQLKKMNIKTVNWFPDPMNWWRFMVDNAPYYNFFLHFDPLVVRKLKNKGIKNVYYLPFASEIDNPYKGEKKYDVSFIGTYSKFRERKLTLLRKFNLNIWGDSRWFDSKLVKFVRGGRIPLKEMKKVIKESKINLNLHFDALKEGTNLRTFEVTGVGGFLLTEYVEDLKKLFNANKEIVVFKNDKELKDKLKYYLDNEKTRERVATGGYHKSKQSHNYTKRMKEMIKIIKSH